uniref:Uncharacterized protein n=1 Tax=Candidatus Kentrum sp. TC TaxID=2126339 RepID=A0A450ZUB4_9GAMM|nr:MAG: hypothetical protein BECKTC1821F_GA0114240_101714 [Candidatus Kentron sp. TC]
MHRTTKILISAALISAMLIGIPLSPWGNEAEAGFFDKMRSAAERATDKAKQSMEKAKRSTKQTLERTERRRREIVDQAKQNSQRTFDQVKQSGREALNRTKQRSRRSLDDFRQRTEQMRKQASEKARQKQWQLERNREEALAQLRQQKALAARKIKKFVQKKNQDVSQIVNLLSSESRTVISRVKQRTDARTAEAVVFLMASKEKGERAMMRVAPILNKVDEFHRDPRIRKKAVTGILVAAAVGTATYQHRDDLKYLATNKTLETVKVPVNGEMRSLNQLYTDAVLQRAPYLRGSDIAEDPAKMLAYGMTSTAKDDLINHFPIVPDGRGGVTTISTATENVPGAKQALAVLQMEAAVEKMASNLAVESAASGQFGDHAQTFAVTYRNVDDSINARFE